MTSVRSIALNRKLNNPDVLRKPVDHSVNGIYDDALRVRAFEPDVDSMAQVNAAIAAAIAAYVPPAPDLGYLEYLALVNQQSTNIPTAVVIVDNLPGTKSYAYDGVGFYSFHSTQSIFLAAKTAIVFTPGGVNFAFVHRAARYSDTQIDLSSANVTTPANTIIDNSLLWIRIYD